VLFVVEQYHLSAGARYGKMKGNWHRELVSRNSPKGVRDLCYNATAKYGLAHRAIYDGTVCVTCKYNEWPANKVVTTYNSKEFENWIEEDLRGS